VQSVGNDLAWCGDRWPNDETYVGWIELAVRNEGVIGDLLAGAAVQTIIAAGANDQRSKAVLSLLLVDAVRGLDQLRRRT
jgi:hypothetical protein